MRRLVRNVFQRRGHTKGQKAANNFSFACIHLYRHILAQELTASSGPYIDVTPLSTTVASIHSQYLQLLQDPTHHMPSKVVTAIQKVLQRHQENPTRSPLRLPILYWIPKMHKNPPKPRFIAASSNVMTTTLAKSLTPVLALIKVRTACQGSNPLHTDRRSQMLVRRRGRHPRQVGQGLSQAFRPSSRSRH